MGFLAGLFGGGKKQDTSSPGPQVAAPGHTNPAPTQIQTGGTGGEVAPNGAGSTGEHPYNPNEVPGGTAVTPEVGGSYAGGVGGAGFSGPAGSELLIEDDLI